MKSDTKKKWDVKRYKLGIFDSLPQEITNQILSYLQYPEREILRRVSRSTQISVEQFAIAYLKYLIKAEFQLRELHEGAALNKIDVILNNSKKYFTALKTIYTNPELKKIDFLNRKIEKLLNQHQKTSAFITAWFNDDNQAFKSLLIDSNYFIISELISFLQNNLPEQEKLEQAQLFLLRYEVNFKIKNVVYEDEKEAAERFKEDYPMIYQLENLEEVLALLAKFCLDNYINDQGCYIPQLCVGIAKLVRTYWNITDEEMKKGRTEISNEYCRHMFIKGEKAVKIYKTNLLFYCIKKRYDQYQEKYHPTYADIVRRSLR